MKTERNKTSPFAKQEFQNKRYFIAGGSSGIGFAVAEELASLGAHLVVSSRPGEKLQNACRQLLQLGASSCVPFELDFSTSNFQSNLESKIKNAPHIFSSGTENSISQKEDIKNENRKNENIMNEKFSGLLLNGGGPHGGKFKNLLESDFNEAHNLLLKGPALLFKSLLPFLNNNSSVVSITSTTVKEPHPDLPLSACYRTGLVALLKNAADDLASLGIRVNNVAPGYTATERLNELKQYAVEKNKLTAEQVEKQWAALAPQNRLASPQEVANTVLFLFSSASSFCTGQTLVVDGGQTRGYF